MTLLFCLQTKLLESNEAPRHFSHRRNVRIIVKKLFVIKREMTTETKTKKAYILQQHLVSSISKFQLYVSSIWRRWQHLSLVTRKPVFDQVRDKQASSASETFYRLEVSDIETRDIILSRQRTTKALIRLRGCAGWSALLLFAYGKTGFLMTWLISQEYPRFRELYCRHDRVG